MTYRYLAADRRANELTTPHTDWALAQGYLARLWAWHGRRWGTAGGSGAASWSRRPSDPAAWSKQNNVVTSVRYRTHLIRIQHYRLNTDPDPIRIQGSDDQKLKKVAGGPSRTSELEKKPSTLKREHPVLQNMTFLNFFSFFVGQFCPTVSGSGSADLIESGSIPDTDSKHWLTWSFNSLYINKQHLQSFHILFLPHHTIGPETLGKFQTFHIIPS